MNVARSLVLPAVPRYLYAGLTFITWRTGSALERVGRKSGVGLEEEVVNETTLNEYLVRDFRLYPGYYNSLGKSRLKIPPPSLVYQNGKILGIWKISTLTLAALLGKNWLVAYTVYNIK